MIPETEKCRQRLTPGKFQKIADEVKDLRHDEQGEKELILSCHVTTWQGNIWEDQDLKNKKT